MNHDRIRAFADNPFVVYPDDQRYADDVRPGGLLDIDPARGWLERIDAARAANLYTFSLPLDARATAASGFGGADLLLFSTYGYLGLNGHPRIVAAATEAAQRWGTTTGGARLLTGTIELHLETERALAAHVGAEAAALFSSGYDANLAAISALFSRRDVAIVDELIHRSILDGCRLAGVQLVRFRHNDTAHLAELLAAHAGSRVMVAVDGVYSMDGDIAPLAEIVALKQRYGAFLLVDESHAVGVLGPEGRGTAAHAGVEPRDVDVVTGSLGKAFPSGGGFVAGSRGLITYLQHGSAPYMFSSAMTPGNAAAIRETLRVIVDEPQHLATMWANAARLRSVVDGLGLDSGNTATPIVPVILGDTVRTYAWARRLLDHGIYTSAVPFPAVAEGQSRLRLCATGSHRPEDFDRLAAALGRLASEELANAG
ncbi:aminotransferase class I/II-fold pyridoxal phosphate-dependent enzyme [Actinoplanes utahensis]|uniref:aminotransferase class I/II-fold pyridoxal phosphate-dependent enzyme n=1 Tax=Actinoplanes utahensis TaxID=1869 RepID=UPI00068CC308|nr:pyridoxal phosphate-dependent aminotransferase family protein [Actinoplanes utahensis]GIF30535.1 2-amino-3-ketobutyrate CoA ligase [Actinoplanes utahensis]